MRVFQGKRRAVTGLAFSPDGTTLAACGQGGDVEFWDPSTGALGTTAGLQSFNAPDNVRFDPSGEWLMVTAMSGNLTVGTRSGTVSRVGTVGSRIVAVSRTGRVVFGGSGLLAYDVTREGVGKRVWSKQLRFAEAEGIDFFPDGTRFAAVEYHNLSAQGEATGCHLRVRSAETGVPLCEVHLGRNRGGPLRVSPGGEWVAFVSARYLTVHHLADPTKTVRLETTGQNRLTGLAFHPAGRYLAVTSNDATVRLHDRDANWAVTRTFDWKVGRLKGVAFNHEGTLAAAAGEKGQVVLWDVDV